jgi:hypothetical protein
MVAALCARMDHHHRRRSLSRSDCRDRRPTPPISVRLTALASLTGRPAAELSTPLNQEPHVQQLFNTRVLHQAEAP